MAKSLNQAFIKAYSKDRAEGAVAKPAQGQSEDDFILRVDTTSVSVPAPHLNRQSTEAAAVGAAKSSVGQGSLSQASSPAAGADDGSRASLRESIANQMHRAGEWTGGDWQDAPIDAFIGGFPMISKVHAPQPATSAATTPQPTNTPAMSATEIPSGKTPTPQIATPAAQIDSEPQRNAPAVSPSIDETKVAPNTAPTVETSAAQAATPAASSSEPNITDSPGAASLEPPMASALPRDEIERIVEDYVRQHGRQGEIFRLDRPTYGDPQAGKSEMPVGDVPVGEAAPFVADLGEQLIESELDESGDESSVFGSPSSSHTDVDISELDAVAEESMPLTSARNEQARVVEDDLRRAAVRVFNPVWEVDKLQWPPVCLELLNASEDGMTRVAQNLIKACEDGLQVLAVTSPQGGEGRTTVACCLAKLAGAHGLRVAFVDGDIENPTLTYQTNLDVEADWKTAILDHKSIEEVAVHSLDDQVTLIPLLNPVQDHELASDDNRIAFMLQQLSESFDLVIVDMGHMDSSRSMVMSMAQQQIISAVVTVVDNRISSPQRVEACIRRIRRTGIASIGLVENFAA